MCSFGPYCTQKLHGSAELIGTGTDGNPGSWPTTAGDTDRSYHDLCLRWASAAVLDGSKRFRRIRGYRDLNRLTRGLEQIEQEQETATDQQVA